MLGIEEGARGEEAVYIYLEIFLQCYSSFFKKVFLEMENYSPPWKLKIPHLRESSPEVLV